VLAFPRYGCINNHASILPRYRGAAPIHRAIMDGECKTGVSVMKMDEGRDTGDVILVKEVKIEENDNFETVHDKLALAGSEALTQAVAQIEKGIATYTPQPNEFTYAEKITKADCLIDFNKDIAQVHNQIRGLSPVPLAFTKTPDGKILKVVKARKSDLKSNAQNGEVVCLDKAIFVKCNDGVIALDVIVPEGKGKMNSADFINGRKIFVGDILG
jgi:methionyl-tRNA formyltransferase